MGNAVSGNQENSPPPKAEDGERQFLERWFLPVPNITMPWKKSFKKSVSTRNCQTNIPSLYISNTNTSCDMYIVQLVKIEGGIVSIYLKGNMIPSTKIISKRSCESA